MREILGDYEPRGRTIQGVGKFIAFGLDDPFHITTVTGLTLYGVGKLMESRSVYGLRRAKVDIALSMMELRNVVRELTSLKVS
ncbi:MAG: hypothetical protein RXS23_06790 [Metallosphaera yellowstonensis]|jgi:hypothetical protein|uniref:Uncharacterized protein n=1 Tax=Metallosphaera yellowstonensis MK1 TaxID=671065 RepID=H2C647_9CREN|nr:hypothetical protein [Metallosphaera yellowstonensis]EHP69274.1 hypothetical protein MetMK1DRAFT_00020230 [Metallosphaera yellowstonensis MK1]